eukprot:gene10504-10664_t
MQSCSFKQPVPSSSKQSFLGFRPAGRDASKFLGRCRLSLHATAAAALTPSDEHSHHQQQQCWFQTEQAESLRQVFNLPPYRFQTLIHQEPTVMSYQVETLALTLQALSEALFSSHKAVVQVIERRPAILLQPAQPRMILQQLAALLDRSPQQTAFLLAPYPHLLALPPQQLQTRINCLCDVLSVPQQHLQAAIAAAGAPSFLHLLALPAQSVAQQLSDLSAALEAAPATSAQLVLVHPHLLGMSAAVLRSRVFALADAAGLSCRQLMVQLDNQQVRGLAGLLLLSPGRLSQQLAGVESLLDGRQPRDVAVRLLLRLGTRVSLPEAQPPEPPATIVSILTSYGHQQYWFSIKVVVHV